VLQDTEKWWQGLCVSIIHQSMLAVGTPIPGRLAVRNQTKKQPVIQDCRGLSEGQSTLPHKTYTVSKPHKKLGRP